MHDFIKSWLLILAIQTIALPLRAQWKLARIKGPNTIVEVRQGKGTKFHSVDTIKTNELFYCKASNSDWWKVSTFPDDSGYVHKSRIQLIESLTNVSMRALLLSVFRQHKDLAERFKEALRTNDSIAYQNTRRKFEEHHEMRYAPLLEFFTIYFCETGDTLLLRKLLLTMWADHGTADESPSFAVGDAFVCKPKTFADVLRVLPTEQKAFILDSIDWGLLNRYDINERKNNDYMQLKKQLDKLR
jgi:hypothetical protein